MACAMCAVYQEECSNTAHIGGTETKIKFGFKHNGLRVVSGRAPQHQILEGLYRAPHGSQPRAGPSQTWTTNLLRHWDYDIGRRH